MPSLPRFLALLLFSFSLSLPLSLSAAMDRNAFLGEYCHDCHDAESHKGGLNLDKLTGNLTQAAEMSLWTKIVDRVQSGEMPPKDKPRADQQTHAAFLSSLSSELKTADLARQAREGRATWRRLNQAEYENTLRDLLGLPWLQITSFLPEDGVIHHSNKVAAALDISHVQMAQYLEAADYAIRESLETFLLPEKAQTQRYYAREQGGFFGKAYFGQFNRSPERSTFPMIGSAADLEALKGEKGMRTVGAANPKLREEEGYGVVASSYEPIEPSFDGFKAQESGIYTIRIKARSFWAGPDSEKTWWKPSREKLSAGRTEEPVVLYASAQPRILRRLGSFDFGPQAAVREMTVPLLKGETIRPDAARLFRSRPGKPWHNPLATPEGQPGVNFHWMEISGPIAPPTAKQGRELLFGNLSVKQSGRGPLLLSSDSTDRRLEVTALLEKLTARVYRHPATKEETQRFYGLFETALSKGADFTNALITAETAVLCSPPFLAVDEAPGPLDNADLAARLSHFLINSEPDAALRAAADAPAPFSIELLQAHAQRLLGSPAAQRFAQAFLDYWLDLRKIDANSPDEVLYADYYLDDYLVESARDETQHFFAALLQKDLPVRHLVRSDFVMVNDRLASHYGLSQVHGAKIRRVPVPADSPRGGLLTQASILKITANGTTTSPVLRGAWITERILGKEVPPPPPAIPAVEPDTRGATTIRQQLEKHRSVASCQGCHAKIDPPGFALEAFDVLGGFRTAYRALGGTTAEPGYGKNGQPFAFFHAQPVDPSGQLADGRGFRDLRSLQDLLLADERQLARNLVQQLITYATGASVSFADREEVERILDDTAAAHFPVKQLVLGIVRSRLFGVK